MSPYEAFECFHVTNSIWLLVRQIPLEDDQLEVPPEVVYTPLRILLPQRVSRRLLRTDTRLLD